MATTKRRRPAPLPRPRGDRPHLAARPAGPAGRRGVHLRHAPEPVLRPLGRVRAAPRVHARRRHPPPRLEGLVRDRQVLHQAVRGETNLRATSWSMSASRCTTAAKHRKAGTLNKYDYACTVAACLAYLPLRQQDSVGLITFDEDVRAGRAAAQPQLHIDAIVKALHVSKPREKTDIEKILRRVAESDARPRAGRARLRPARATASRCSRGWRCSGTAGTTSWSSTSWTTTN